MIYKRILFSLFIFLGLFSLVSGVEEYSAGNDFLVYVDSLTDHVYNNNMDNLFSLRIKNTLNRNQEIKIITSNVSGWDIIVDDQYFVLAPNEEKEVNIRFKANSEFDYSTNVVSSDTIKIIQKEEYKGYFKFPIEIIGKYENMTLKYELNIDKLVLEPEYKITLATDDLSPISPLKFAIESINVIDPELVDIYVDLNGNKIFTKNTEFSKDNFYQIFTVPIDSTLKPGDYSVDVVVRTKVKTSENLIKEWKESKVLKVIPFENLEVRESKVESYFKDIYNFNITNLGNTKSKFEKEVNFGYFKGLFFGTNSNYVNTENGVKIIEELNSGESKSVEYHFNYISLYFIFLILFVTIAFIYIRKNSNPLVVDAKLYDINKVEHEGIKSFKVRIGFENVKESEIDEIRLIFRMPSYLNVRGNSFSLSEPNHVLKGRNQFKLIWDFKRFEKSDSRIIGFTLENKRGILGDIKLPDLEFEIKVNGKVRRYYNSFPTIKS